MFVDPMTYGKGSTEGEGIAVSLELMVAVTKSLPKGKEFIWLADLGVLMVLSSLAKDRMMEIISDAIRESPSK
ncbi:MAG: hypothetical protein M0R80_13580 [Proteobacteria bacterium]|jgi:hypothetical protein|nr:hypothetical protein [Pseudomonadota bacterium]